MPEISSLASDGSAKNESIRVYRSPYREGRQGPDYALSTAAQARFQLATQGLGNLAISPSDSHLTSSNSAIVAPAVRTVPQTCPNCVALGQILSAPMPRADLDRALVRLDQLSGLIPSEHSNLLRRHRLSKLIVIDHRLQVAVCGQADPAAEHGLKELLQKSRVRGRRLGGLPGS